MSAETNAALLAKLKTAYECELAALRTRLEAAEAALGRCRRIVDAQAEDEGLWFDARRAPEAHLQHALRHLHAAVEYDASGSTQGEPKEVT